MAGIYSQGGSAGHRYAGWLSEVEAKNFTFGGKVFNGSPSAIYVGSKMVWAPWLLKDAAIRAILGAFGVDGKAVIKATNAYLTQLAASGQAGKDKATALAGWLNTYAIEDAHIVYSLVPTLGVTRWLCGDGSAYIETPYYPNGNSHVKTYLVMRKGSNFAPYGIIGGWKYGWNGNIFSNYNNDVRITQVISDYLNKEMYAEQNKNLAYLEGALVKEHTYSQFTLAYKLVLFRNWEHISKFDIADFVVSEEDTMLYYFIPYEVGTDGLPANRVSNREIQEAGAKGMLDLLSGIFYPNINGSGSFTISETPSTP